MANAMSRRDDDPLAIHVVAASALSVLRELIQSDGSHYPDLLLQAGLFGLASSRVGGVEGGTPISPEMDALIDRVASAIRSGGVSRAADLEVGLDKGERRLLLAYIFGPYNFLKHADRDPSAVLDVNDVDPTGAIIHAIAAFSMIFPDDAIPEEIRAFLDLNGVV